MTSSLDPGTTTAVSRHAQAVLPRAIVIESPLPGSQPRDAARPTRRPGPGPITRIDNADGAQAQRNRAARARLQKPETGASESGASQSGTATAKRGAQDGGRRGSPADDGGASALRLATIGFTAQLLAQSESETPRADGLAPEGLLARGHAAYRRAGGEPPLFTDEATLFSLTA
jgi:hypothetical protein